MSNISPAAPSLSAEAAIKALFEKSQVSALQLKILAICFMLSMLEGFDVLAISYASVAISEQLSLPADQLGLLISAGLLGMTIGALFLAILSDMFGRRRMILIALVISGSSMCATGLTDSAWLIGALRIATGLGIGILLATTTAVVSEFMPEKHRSMAVGVTLAGYPAGAMLGGFLSAGLIEQYGWPAIFFGGGALTLLMVIVIWFVLPESLQFLVLRQPANALDRANRTLGKLGFPLLKALAPQAEMPPRPGPRRLLQQDLRSRTLWLWAAFGFAYGTLYFLFGWIPKIVSNSGVEQSIAIYALTFFNLGAVIGNSSMGQIAKYIGLGRVIILLMLLGAGFILLFPFFGGIALMALSALAGATIQGSFAGLYAAAAHIYPAEVRSTGIGWGIGLGRVGAVISPYLAGVLLAQGTAPVVLFSIFAATMVLSAMCVRRLRI